MRRTGAWAWLAVLTLATAYLAVQLTGGLKLDSNILSLLPSMNHGSAVEAAQNRITQNVSRRVIFLVGSGSLNTSAKAASTLSEALKRSATITKLTSTLDPTTQRKLAAAYFPYRAGLLSQADRERLLANDGKALADRAVSILYGPGGYANTQLIAHDPFLLLPSFLTSLPTPQSALQLRDGVLTVRHGHTSYVLVSAELSANPFSMRFQKRFGRVVSAALAKMKRQTPGLTVLKTGAIFYATRSASEAMRETSIIGFASIAGTLLLIFLVFRGLRPILLGLTAIATGILCAVAGTLLIFGHIHVVALLFGSSLIGISIDYSFEYFCEYFEPELRAPHARLRRVLPAIAMGLGTTLIGYLTLLIAPFPGLQQVACFSLIGLVAAFLTVVLWFPVLDSANAPANGRKALHLAAFHWALWETPKFKWARMTILAGCAIGAIAGASAFHIDDNVRHLQTLPAQLKQQEGKIEKLTGAPSGAQFLSIEGADEQALLRKEERLAPMLSRAIAQKQLGGYTAISEFVPSIARQKENHKLITTRLTSPYLTHYVSQIGFAKTIEPGTSGGYLTPSDLPHIGPLAFLDLLDAQTGHHPMHIVLLHGVRDIAAITRLAESIPGATLVSPADDWSRLFAVYRRYAVALLALSILLMCPLLIWRYGFTRGLRVLAPPVAAVILAPLLAALTGVAFTFFNAMALILVLSIGVDYSIFCVEAAQTRKAVTSLAVSLASITTILSFGMLAFSHIFAVHAFGMTMFIGITLAYLLAPMARQATTPRITDPAA